MRRALVALVLLVAAVTAVEPPRPPSKLACADIPLCGAVEKGETMTVRQLLEDGADVRARDKSGFTALHAAAERGEAVLVKVLLGKAKPDVDALDINECGGRRFLRALLCADRPSPSPVRFALRAR